MGLLNPPSTSLCTKCGVGNDIKLNKVQYEAAKIVSGAMYGTSSEKLLQEPG